MNEAELLKKWCEMERLADHFDEDGEFEAICSSYHAKVDSRIKACHLLAGAVDDRLLYYTLAELHDRYDIEDWPECPNKRKAAFYAMRAIREDWGFGPAWALLSEIYFYLVDCWSSDEATRRRDEMGIADDEEDGERPASYLDRRYRMTEEQKKRIRMIDRAISSIKRAIALDPANEAYHGHLELCYRQRNEEYKPAQLYRNPASIARDI